MQKPNRTLLHITALFTEKSAIKNLRIVKAYHQQMAPTLKVRELLSYLEFFITIINHCSSHR
jgi:hypothetical protein